MELTIDSRANVHIEGCFTGDLILSSDVHVNVQALLMESFKQSDPCFVKGPGF